MPCSWGLWWHLPVAFFGTLAAIIAHELTHYVAMWPVAERVDLHVEDWTLSEMRVESQIRNEPWRHRWADLAGVAPMLIGVSVLVIWSQRGYPGTDMIGLGAWNMLLWYGFLGGLSDYSRGESVQADTGGKTATNDADAPLIPIPDGGQEFVEMHQQMINLTFLATLSALIGLVYAAFCSGSINDVAWTLANGGMILSCLGIAVILAKHGEPREI